MTTGAQPYLPAISSIQVLNLATGINQSTPSPTIQCRYVRIVRHKEPDKKQVSLSAYNTWRWCKNYSWLSLIQANNEPNVRLKYQFIYKANISEYSTSKLGHKHLKAASGAGLACCNRQHIASLNKYTCSHN